MNVKYFNSYESMSYFAASKLIRRIREIKQPVLGLATGSTPLGLYQELVSQHNKGVVSFENVITFNLDEYVGLGDSHAKSYKTYMRQHLIDKVDFNPKSFHIPNGQAIDLEKECNRYESLLLEKGPIDVQVLGLGHNGHIGFNEPGTPFKTKTHVVELDITTREANSRYFSSVSEVPKRSITMGIKSILRSDEILLLVSGEGKASALDKLLSHEISKEFPASALHRHDAVTVLVDQSSL
ncbi:glucosamine-6-phosphate deaminase [Alkalibacillus haloalkaliphilus]|uniref:Glucosamine-6-phosphate deaminase n=1 Tax=Alkalibacillus haloalkaliphilus TaxID=94136 RepID=A0A511WBE8_9BACI|nr:glucosamine-6-phosphate deaminase [Alkalibacillus haloalkaliphilus]GEN46632.1 glucosamine-6-phosphate deaminase 1 [Alkalibacillus haloalkaliphilus]